MTKIINFFGGPGLGKSTLAAGVFHALKEMDIDCELVTEQAKTLTWSKRQLEITCQPYVFGKQLKMLHVLNGQVDFVVTDSPVLLSCFYARNRYPRSFTASVVDIFNTFNNINYLLSRTKQYNPNGRNQTLEEAIQIDDEIKTLLEMNKIFNKSGYIEIGPEVQDRVKFVINDILFDEI